MSKFVKYLSKAHLNNMNVALYDSAVLRAENVISNKSVGTLKFNTVEEAEEWFDSLPGNDMGRLSNAIEALDSRPDNRAARS